MRELSIKYKKIAELNSYKNNPRTHSQEQVAQLVRSIEEFGWTNPILIDEKNTIIAGHGRLEAAKKLGLEQVPTITLDELSEAQKRALVIADNKLALNAGWDYSTLIEELKILVDVDYELAVTGFHEDEINTLLKRATVIPAIEPGSTDPTEEWGGMPEYVSNDETSFKRLIVHFDNQDDFDDFCERIEQRLTEKTKSIWHPKKEKDDLKSIGYVDAG